jgi:transketolase
VVIIDRNKLQSIHSTEDTLGLEPFVDKWQAFGWNVVNIDGHDHEQLISACNSKITDKPLCVVANTTKGKGISFMENQVLWHYRSPHDEEYEAAMRELNNA